jgi:hypothetical protein
MIVGRQSDVASNFLDQQAPDDGMKLAVYSGKKIEDRRTPMGVVTPSQFDGFEEIPV